uniref:Ubiquitin-like domain-containing protein n=1 Tax=Chromera velia CCMP2878 TaxID=1169474 RepID=A0A0G4F6X8_9ALVE|eukprot:Cvel_15533.t1-p1 / transcript=Cvel_15533.t1 / gene=Cvel_15533 / organism=Chromera_velia_CCMP2878 / gene_product=Ubiquitin-40S ribosomal protein S27a, putative / transcript_product=Ubiquitin-40S ribosomal protein S27a, putative / location=Cvel_scaffold1154:3667-4502(-) / protein_length=154 / sequence_SO=supercontig / SO=protein_coding / is_pseudo=false
MQIFVRNLEGKNLLLSVGPETSVEEVKALVEARDGVPAELQRLIYGGKQLVDEETLEESSIDDEATLYLSASLLGGGKKRKKKQYTKPKKNKHKKKKVKLAVLKFYRVDDNDKVSRLRKECPVGGPGVFMAMHHNRYTSGKSGVTYLLKQQEEA